MDKKVNIVNKETIKQSLEDKHATMPCPRCGNSAFSIGDGFFTLTVQEDLKKFSIGGKSMPVSAVVCNNCGYVSLHAIGVLGLLPKSE